MFQSFAEFKKKHQVADSTVALLTYSQKSAQLFVITMRCWLQTFEIQHLLLPNTLIFTWSCLEQLYINFEKYFTLGIPRFS